MEEHNTADWNITLKYLLLVTIDGENIERTKYILKISIATRFLENPWENKS